MKKIMGKSSNYINDNSMGFNYLQQYFSAIEVFTRVFTFQNLIHSTEIVTSLLPF